MAEEVARLVARDGSRCDEGAHQPQWDVEYARGDQQSGGEQQRVARQEEADEQPGLSEHDRQNTQPPHLSMRKFGSTHCGPSARTVMGCGFRR